MKVLSITQQLRRPRQILGITLLGFGFAFAGSVSVSSQSIDPTDSVAPDIDTYIADPTPNVDPSNQVYPSVTALASTPVGALAGSTSGSVIPNIDQMTGWLSCTTCAGRGGNGPSATHAMSHTASPSLDGSSAHYWLGGSTPYSNALWWKQLGARPAAHNFVYDFYFYMQNPRASQAIEFDMNQSVDGRKLIFGTECDIAGGHWDVWDTANAHWVNTGIYCGVPPAYTWNHVTIEFQRTSGDQARFVAITLNGKKSYINRTFGSQGSGVQELNVAVQMDGNRSQTNYDMWVDRMSVSYW